MARFGQFSSSNHTCKGTSEAWGGSGLCGLTLLLHRVTFIVVMEYRKQKLFLLWWGFYSIYSWTRSVHLTVVEGNRCSVPVSLVTMSASVVFISLRPLVSSHFPLPLLPALPFSIHPADDLRLSHLSQSQLTCFHLPLISPAVYKRSISTHYLPDCQWFLCLCFPAIWTRTWTCTWSVPAFLCCLFPTFALSECPLILPACLKCIYLHLSAGTGHPLK